MFVQSLEEDRNLGRRAIRLPMMRKMARIGQVPDIEVGEELTQPVGPGDLHRGVVLGPAYDGQAGPAAVYPNIKAYPKRIGDRPTYRRAVAKAEPRMSPVLG